MKKNILLGFAACGAMLLSANVASAQETVVIEEATLTATDVECADHYYVEKGSGWFLQLGAGINAPFVDSADKNGDKTTHLTAAYNLGFGKWFSPYLAWRVSGYYGKLHMQYGDYYKAQYANLNVDLMWDMFNSLGGVNDNRTFSIIPFVGIGGTYVWDFTGGDVLNKHGKVRNNTWLLPVSAGLQLRFRLCENVDFIAEGRASLYGDNFSNHVSGDPIECNVEATAGLSFAFGGRSYKSYNPCTYLGYINQLNGQINDLRGSLATCGAALAAAEAQLPCPEVVAVECPEVQAPLMTTVRFSINSAKVTSKEMVNVFNIAQWMKANPDAKVVIKGYADKKTGTASYNQKLSERRAQSVYNILTKEYGVAADRLTMKGEGSGSQIYDTNDWNRIVIFSQD
ncbi:OmpA family protein [uncultured Muribaculum sp.]|uniref:OmpA family protein n=1 Tax=uncultured Muribaculum sp. TaxID=1918613 RepID=UPI00258F9D81|nr:OmpA family protein [uncultured Muribaculum sp.]